MAGVSMKDIKSRIKRMESTRQITKAMEMVASSKLRGAQERVIASRPYFELLHETMHEIACADRELSSPYMKKHGQGKACFVVIAGDRGLAGGYNNNVLKLALSQMEGKDAIVLPVGKKAAEFFGRRGVQMLETACPVAEDGNAQLCREMAGVLCEKYLAGEISGVTVCYTNFASMLTQTPAVLPLLPLTISEGSAQQSGRRALTLYEPSSTAVFNSIVPQYISGVLYGALRESQCAEQAARRSAMDSATKNAGEMIDDLRLQYNRSRQGAITQEITEIVAGADN